MDALKQTTSQGQLRIVENHTDLVYTFDELAELVDAGIIQQALLVLIARAPPTDATKLFKAFWSRQRDDCRKTVLSNIDPVLFYALACELTFDKDAVRQHYVDNDYVDLVRWLDHACPPGQKPHLNDT